MPIDRARAADLPAVERLLLAAELPLEGARDAFALGVVARDRTAIVAAAAIEPFGTAGLLRSVVVAPDRRGSGLGRAVVGAAEDLARSEGIRDLYLLTETAVEWFPRLGYAPVDRGAAAEIVGASIEFTTVCRGRGVAFHRHLD